MIDISTTQQTRQAVRRAANEHGINPDQFLNFWQLRFGHYAPVYIHEWPDRIAHGRAHTTADDQTRQALQQAGFHLDR